MRKVIGVDACKDGWVFIQLMDSGFSSAKIYRRLAHGIDASPDAEAIGVDMPIGYPSLPAAERQADGAARAFVNPRHSSVFPALHPDVLHLSNYDEANRKSREVTGRGITKPSFSLREKILEVERIAAVDNRVYEVHPEVSFRELAGCPLATTKRQWNGQAERRNLLAKHGIAIPDYLDDATSAGADDILDAAAAAWSAHRIAMGHAISLPNPPEHSDEGLKVAIWY